jgi:hypothetical protein
MPADDLLAAPFLLMGSDAAKRPSRVPMTLESMTRWLTRF